MITTLAAYEWFSFDWGIHLGRLERIRDMSLKGLRSVTVLPRLRDGGLEVYMGREREVIERLRLDETFMTFAEFRCF